MSVHPRPGVAGWLEKTALAIVLLTAVCGEIAHIPYYVPKFDQAQVLYLARDFITEGVFPTHGSLNSRFAFNPPFFVWLYIPPMMLFRDVSWVLVTPALTLHILALLVVFRIGKDYFSVTVGLSAMTLYALSTWGPYFGRSSWAQGLLPAHYIMAVFCLFRWLVDGKAWYSAPLLVLGAWITGIHWGGAVALGVAMIAPFFFATRFRPGPLLAGAVVASILWLPYLAFEKDRAGVDILVLVKGPLSTQSPAELTPLCAPKSNPSGAQSLAQPSGSLVVMVTPPEARDQDRIPVGPCGSAASVWRRPCL